LVTQQLFHNQFVAPDNLRVREDALAHRCFQQRPCHEQAVQTTRRPAQAGTLEKPAGIAHDVTGYCARFQQRLGYAGKKPLQHIPATREQAVGMAALRYTTALLG
jgi:hypothetical protein